MQFILGLSWDKRFLKSLAQNASPCGQNPFEFFSKNTKEPPWIRPLTHLLFAPHTMFRRWNTVAHQPPRCRPPAPYRIFPAWAIDRPLINIPLATCSHYVCSRVAVESVRNSESAGESPIPGMAGIDLARVAVSLILGTIRSDLAMVAVSPRLEVARPE